MQLKAVSLFENARTCSFFFVIHIILFYKSGTSRFRHGTNPTIMPTTGGIHAFALTTGAAFIRDNFVDYPDTQLTKREIKARRAQVCRFWVDPSGNLLRRATYLWKFNVLHIQRVRVAPRPLWPLRLSLERATDNSSVAPTTRNTFIRNKFDDCSGALLVSEEIKTWPIQLPGSDSWLY